jgi:uncharacterized iron-regulated protein
MPTFQNIINKSRELLEDNTLMNKDYAVSVNMITAKKLNVVDKMLELSKLETKKSAINKVYEWRNHLDMEQFRFLINFIHSI